MSTGWATPYFRRKRLDSATNVAVYTTPSPLYLGLTTTLLAESASVLPSPSPEAAGNGYARTPVVFDATMWTPADASGTTTNLVAVTCFTATATWTIPGIGFFFADAASGGNILIAGAIDVDKLVLPLTGEVVAFPPGSLTLTLAAP